MENTQTAIEVTASAEGRATVRLAGVWSIREPLPEPEEAARKVEESHAKTVDFDSSAIERWDSGLLVFLLRLENLLKEKGIAFERGGLPDGVRGMLVLAEVVPEREGARGKDDGLGWVGKLGVWATGAWTGVVSGVEFLGQCVIAFGSLVRGHARFRRSDLFL